MFGKDDGPANHPSTIERALWHNFDVELDVWYLEGWWLGHDKPEYKVDMDFLDNRRFWIHCKNISAMTYLQPTKLNYFWHEEDSYTLTSHGYIWAYPDEMAIAGGNTIAVKPEINNTDVNLFSGICSDNIMKYYYETRTV